MALYSLALVMLGSILFIETHLIRLCTVGSIGRSGARGFFQIQGEGEAIAKAALLLKPNSGSQRTSGAASLKMGIKNDLGAVPLTSPSSNKFK